MEKLSFLNVMEIKTMFCVINRFLNEQRKNSILEQFNTHETCNEKQNEILGSGGKCY